MVCLSGERITGISKVEIGDKMEIKRENIEYDHQSGKLTTFLMLKLFDGNGMMLKAKAELYADIMDSIGKLVDAKIAEFAEKYGDEVIKFAHDNIAGDDRDCEPEVKKYVSSKEIQQRLLNRAFESN